MSDLQPEDAKLVTLARSARGRTGAPEGAEVVAYCHSGGRAVRSIAFVSMPSFMGQPFGCCAMMIPIGDENSG